MAKKTGPYGDLRKKALELGFDPTQQDIVDTGSQIQQETRLASGDTLKDHQRLKLIEWIASGLTNKQINSRASKYIDPFHVGSEIIYYYRTYKGLDIAAMKRLQEANAFNTGLAVRAQRIEHLNMIAQIIYNHLVDEGGTWVKKLKQLGRNGPIIEEVEFNAEEVKEFRMLLNDIAGEVGQRVHKIDVNQTVQVKGYTTVSPDDWDSGAVVEGSTTEVLNPEAPQLPPVVASPEKVEFRALDPFAKDAPAGSTMFPRPKKSPKTTPERTAHAKKAAGKSNKVQSRRKNATSTSTKKRNK